MTQPFAPPSCLESPGSTDVSGLILCDYLDGEVVGSAIAVYTYDEFGNPVGAPTFKIPGTNTAYVVQGALQPCGTDQVVVLTSQAKELGAAASWTPADVAGDLTSLSVTVLSGTATVTDENGTVSAALPAGLTLSWSTSDDNTLTGPDAITTAAASSAIVAWTQRA